MDMRIPLTPDLQKFVETEAAERDYSDGAAFVRDLILREKADKRLREALLEGKDSPLEGPADEAFFERLDRRLLDRRHG